jgi:hypothetical protein
MVVVLMVEQEEQEHLQVLLAHLQYMRAAAVAELMVQELVVLVVQERQALVGVMGTVRQMELEELLILEAEAEAEDIILNLVVLEVQALLY